MPAMALHLAVRTGPQPDSDMLPQGKTNTPSGPDPEAEALFALLDGRELIVLGRHFRIDVFSVCEMGGCRYIQLSLHGSEEYMLTLRVASGADSSQVIPRLLNWLTRPSTSGEVLNLP
jgi:hypothetical protein